MVNDYIFNEVMSIPSEKTISLGVSISKMSQFCSDIKILQDDEYNIYYQVDANVIKEKVDDLSDLMELNQGGWVLSENKKFLVLYI
jgi:hypothetical protein